MVGKLPINILIIKKFIYEVLINCISSALSIKSERVKFKGWRS